MRQNNQNKRMRGRSRKGPNPLSRSHESNGPDVKIRGTAMHIAEKYVQLSRDAQASGDRVIAENYLQHAEHYFRIVAAAQAQAPQQNQPAQQSGNARDEERDDEQAQAPAAAAAPEASGQPVMPADAPQPFVDAMPGINSKTANGSGHPAESAEASGDDEKAASAGGDDAGEDASKPRRRVRGTRGRGSRRTTQSDAEASADDAAVAEKPKTSDAPEAPSVDENQVTVTEA